MNLRRVNRCELACDQRIQVVTDRSDKVFFLGRVVRSELHRVAALQHHPHVVSWERSSHLGNDLQHTLNEQRIAQHAGMRGTKSKLYRRLLLRRPRQLAGQWYYPIAVFTGLRRSCVAES